MAITDWKSDLNLAVRSLWRSPGFTIIAVGMLSLAIGVTTGLFNVVNTVLMKPLPFAQPERLIDITASAPGSQFPTEFDPAPEFYIHFREHSKLIENISTYNSFTNTLRVGDRVERVRMSTPTPSLFATLGVNPMIGRLPSATDGQNTVLISDDLWESWFNRDPDILGKTLDLFDQKLEIIAVMAPSFRFPRPDTLLWIPFEINASDIESVGDFDTPMVARLKPGVSMQALASELDQLARQLPARFGGSPDYTRLISQYQSVLRPLTERLLGPFAQPLWILLGAAGLVLLIACANVTSLLLVRTELRQREMAVRSALGAGRRQLFRLHQAETTLIAVLAGAIAVLLAVLMVPVMVRLAPSGIPRLDQVGLDPAMLGFAFIAALASAAICGLIPALRAATPDLARLRDGGRSMTGRQHWPRQALVAGQTALAVVLLIGSGLLLRTVFELRMVDPGYDSKNVFTFQIAPERTELSDPQSYARFHLRFLERLNMLPGVQSVGLIENVPLNESTATVSVRTEGIGATSEEGVLVKYTYSAGDYFRTMGIALLQGRNFDANDHETTRGNVVISQSVAARLWPGRDPLGQRLRRTGQVEWETVIGVVEDVRQDGLASEPEALLYLPLVGPTPELSRPLGSPAYVVKSTRAETIAADVRALVREVAPEAPMYREFTLAGLVRDSTAQVTFTLLTLSLAAGLALLLGAIGLYGVLSYIVAERTREIGIRMALGARAKHIRMMVVAQGARVVTAGALIGIVIATLFSNVLDSLLFRVQPRDLTTFIVMPMAMLAIGILASYLPARKASNVDPIISLRRE